MKTRFSLLLAALCGLASLTPLHAQTTAFTYQGRLTSGGNPASGSHDFQFTLFGAPSGGSPVEEPVSLSAVGVTNGVFTVPLDFGAAVFTGADRWLDIAVRPAGNGAFTPLNPRQPITPTPYAVTALFAKQVPGVSGNALHAADGSPQNAVFVDNDGRVGIGTINPLEKLDLRSGGDSYLRVDSLNGDLRVNGGSDGHFGFFNDSLAAGAGTHLIGQGQSRLFVQNNGNVGLGTTTPAAKLDVRGDIRLGPNAEFRATSSEENLRIVRGAVNAAGTILQGSGFTVVFFPGVGYGVTFTTPFAGPPVVTGAPLDDTNTDSSFWVRSVTAGAVMLAIKKSTTSTLSGAFHFIAIGPR